MKRLDAPVPVDTLMELLNRAILSTSKSVRSSLQSIDFDRERKQVACQVHCQGEIWALKVRSLCRADVFGMPNLTQERVGWWKDIFSEQCVDFTSADQSRMQRVSDTAFDA